MASWIFSMQLFYLLVLLPIGILIVYTVGTLAQRLLIGKKESKEKGHHSSSSNYYDS
ncbi:hypothetical protein NCCP2222_00440 [Sporosarcina sp. NCCP-2222]|nr:hypothetical protein NCCP2222_00440 [Sporosarcina sp. NCCP-2222]